MRQLRRPACPDDLTPPLAEALTKRFATDSSSSVWKSDAIKAALLAMSNGNCAYCEANLTKQSMFMEVEHYYPKSLYPERVVVWSNLLPACSRCNKNKGSHDTGREPIVDPCCDDPRQHLSLINYRFHRRSIVGRSTINVLDLNDFERNWPARIAVGQRMQDMIESLDGDFITFSENPSRRNQNKMLRRLCRILSEAAPGSEYGSTAATVLLEDPDFASVKQALESLALWDADLDARYRAAASIAYTRFAPA